MIDKTLPPTCPQCMKRPCMCWKINQEKREAERIASEVVTSLERYRNAKARLAIWLDSTVSVNRWVFISILWVATLSVGFILLSFILGNTMECKVVL